MEFTTMFPQLKSVEQFPDTRAHKRKGKPDIPWPKGEWDEEPDKVHWVDPETDMDCLIVRGPVGGLCGYVAVEPDHPLHGVPYGEPSPALEERLKERLKEPVGDTMPAMLAALGGGVKPSPDLCLTVHGGLTFSDKCQEGGKICHAPRPGRPHDVWWFGFDCAHAWDYTPGMDFRGVYDFATDDLQTGRTYRNLAYVKRECEKLAKQLKALT